MKGIVFKRKSDIQKQAYQEYKEDKIDKESFKNSLLLNKEEYKVYREFRSGVEGLDVGTLRKRLMERERSKDTGPLGINLHYSGLNISTDNKQGAEQDESGGMGM